MAKGVTIKDVAAEAGVSFKTVSNVINGTGSMRESTRGRVLEAMDKLNYTINLSARSLKTGTTGLLGLAIFDFSQPFASYLADQIIVCAREHHYGVIINTYGQNEHAWHGRCGRRTIWPQTGGSSSPIMQWDNTARCSTKAISCVTRRLGRLCKVDQVTMPNVEAMRYTTNRCLIPVPFHRAVRRRRLARRKHYRQATEGTQELRVQGYMQAYEEHGIEARMDMLFSGGLLTSDSGVRAQRILMMDQGVRPDAIICLNDAMALGALLNCRYGESGCPTMCRWWVSTMYRRRRMRTLP